jgi:hypothetical protein
MKPVDNHSTAICILGMHRSGTSCVTRAINLLGVYLGEEAKVRGHGADNVEGFWEHPKISTLQERLLARLHRTWDTAAPLPDGWQQSGAVRPFRDELKRLIATDFADHKLWAWKDPRTCLLLPLWRDVLAELKTKLLCVFVVRNPIDVANSLIRRDPIPFGKALGVWFNYCIVALKDATGLPMVFLSYEKCLTSWEPELRRCALELGLEWPVDEQLLRETMNSFIRPDLRHNESPIARLQSVPHPVQELYQTLVEVSARSTARANRFDETVNRLFTDFHAYASFFQTGLDGLVTGNPGEQFGEGLPVSSDARPPYLKRTWKRWQKSFRKRFKRRRPNDPI